jgi:hypothetical protein
MMLIKILILTICVTGCSGHQMLSGDGNGEIDGDLVQPQEIIDIVEEELLDENLDCPLVTSGSLGNCGIPLGFAFNGESCTMITGCNCELPRCRVFQSRAECARKCAEAGRCNISKMPYSHLPGGRRTGVGDYCDAITFCTDEPTPETEDDLKILVPGIECPTTDHSDCSPSICGVSGVIFNSHITTELYLQMCASTLLSEIFILGCTIYL